MHLVLSQEFSITITALFSVETTALIEIVPVVVILISFLLPHHTSYINSPASHISFLSLASLTSSCLSASQEYYFTPLHTPAASPPPYVYSNCLPLPGLPRVPPGELADGEFLSNAMLSLKYKSIAIHWREFSGWEHARAHPNRHVLRRLCHDDQSPCLWSILRSDRSLPEGTSSFQLLFSAGNSQIERSRRRTRRSHPGQSCSYSLDQQEHSPHSGRSPSSNSSNLFSPHSSGPNWKCL